MSETNATIRKCLELLQQIREHLKQHHQWSKTDAELKRLIKELESALLKSRSRPLDCARLLETISKVADIVAALLGLQ